MQSVSVSVMTHCNKAFAFMRPADAAPKAPLASTPAGVAGLAAALPRETGITRVKLYLDFLDMRLYDLAVSGVFEAPSNRSDGKQTFFRARREGDLK